MAGADGCARAEPTERSIDDRLLNTPSLIQPGKVPLQEPLS
jgi:hypothetical protein